MCQPRLSNFGRRYQDTYTCIHNYVIIHSLLENTNCRKHGKRILNIVTCCISVSGKVCSLCLNHLNERFLYNFITYKNTPYMKYSSILIVFKLQETETLTYGKKRLQATELRLHKTTCTCFGVFFYHCQSPLSF